MESCLRDTRSHEGRRAYDAIEPRVDHHVHYRAHTAPLAPSPAARAAAWNLRANLALLDDEKLAATMQDEIDAKTQDALWWKTRCEQQSAASPATSRASLLTSGPSVT